MVELCSEFHLELLRDYTVRLLKQVELCPGDVTAGYEQIRVRRRELLIDVCYLSAVGDALYLLPLASLLYPSIQLDAIGPLAGDQDKLTVPWIRLLEVEAVALHDEGLGQRRPMLTMLAFNRGGRLHKQSGAWILALRVQHESSRCSCYSCRCWS